MAVEPKRAEKSRDTNGMKEGSAATEALVRDVTKAQAVGADTAKAISESVTSTIRQQGETGAGLVEHVASDTARANAAMAEKSEEVGKAAFDAAGRAATKNRRERRTGDA